MNNPALPTKRPLRAALAATTPHALAVSLALNLVLGICVFKLSEAIEATAAPAVDSTLPVIHPSTVLETCKITVTKYRSAKEQGGEVYWGSEVDSCAPVLPIP